MAVLKDILDLKIKLEHESNEKTILSSLKKLDRVKMSLELLQSTGIGKTVNKLGKQNGEIGQLSTRIVANWRGIANKKSEDSGSKNNKITKKCDSDSDKYNASQSKSYHGTTMMKAGRDTSLATAKDDTRKNNSVKLKSREPDIKKKSKTSVEDEDVGNSMSFEDCLEMSDVRKSKRKQSKALHNNSVSHDSSQSVSSRKRKAKELDNVDEVKCRDVQKQKLDSTSSPSQSKLPALLQKEVEVALPTLILPEIQPNYKPTRNFYIIDDSNCHQKKKPVDNDDTYFMSSRHNRTQVFSGRKNYFVSEVSTLKDSCMRVLQDNPRLLLQERRQLICFDILEPVIARLSPEELYELEQNNENITSDTAKLWRTHCQREFKGRFPEDDESWIELYWRLVREREAKLINITANISASMSKSLPVRQTKLAYVDCIVKPPRSVARQQARFGTAKVEEKTVSKKAKLINAITTNVANSTNEVVRIPSSSSSSTSQNPSTQPPQKAVKKIAPLMQKTLKLLKNRFRR